MNRVTGRWPRLAAATALLATTALFGPSSPAHAADPLPDLFVSFDQDPVAEIDNSGTTVGMYVYNYGEADASAVTVTLDLSKVSDQVIAEVPEWTDNCEQDGTKVSCAIGHLPAGQVLTVMPLSLASRTGATPGDAGSVTVSIAGAEDDMSPDNNTTTFPVTIKASGPDLVAGADDLNDKNHPVGPGDAVPLYAGVFNEGDTTASEYEVRVIVPTGATFVERYSDCTYTDYYPNDKGLPYVYGPGEVTCPVAEPLAPGEALLFFDDQTGDSLFNVTFGKNLPGPEQLYGSFNVALAGQSEFAKDTQRAKGTGPSFASALRKQQAKVNADRQLAAGRELDESDNYADFSFWSKKNTLDVAVTVPTVKGSVGQTVDLAYEVVNNGPADGGGPSVVITAPKGTVLLPSEWCYTDGTDGRQQPESAKLRCNFESEFPSTASGYGRIKTSVKLKIKATPGDDGVIVVDGAMSSTESNPKNNTARIVIDTGAGGGAGGGGGSGGGLPITGAPAAMLAGVGAVVIALGATVLVLFRRRRVVLQVPRD